MKNWFGFEWRFTTHWLQPKHMHQDNGEIPWRWVWRTFVIPDQSRILPKIKIWNCQWGRKALSLRGLTGGWLSCCSSTHITASIQKDTTPLYLKCEVRNPGERLLIFDLNSKSNYTSLFLAGIIFGSVWNTQFLSLFKEPGLCTNARCVLSGQLEENDEQLAEFDKQYI